jgi:nucleoside-diphosphate-sugar epimerase
MRYFLTGATGFIGGRLARQLVAAGHEVSALARDPARAGDLAALGVTLVPGDVTESAGLAPAMRGMDGVFHVAGWYKVGVRDRSPGERINVQGTRNVLDAMAEAGVPKGVYTSTLAVYSDTHGRMVDETYRHAGPWLSEYDRTKWVAHYEVAEPAVRRGLPLVIVMPGLVYGPGDTSSVRDALLMYLRRRLPMIPAGAEFCWAHVDDVARGHVLAMEKGRPGESYIIAGPRHSFREAFELAERITGIPAPRLQASPGAMRALARLMDLVGAVVPLPPAYAGESLRVSAGVTYLGDNAKAKRELGYAVRPLAEGLRETLEHELTLMKRERLTPRPVSRTPSPP